MQFESLKVFCDVARHRSFSVAANANHVSQSAVSQIVNMLERRLGVLLVDRSKRPLQLTREGRAYFDGCRKLVDQYLEVEANVRTLNAQFVSAVQVAAIYSVGLRDMSQYVQRFVAQNPGAQVNIEYLHPGRVCEKVLAGEADFGLVSFPQATRKLAAVPWREEEMVLACGPAHPLANRRTLRIAELAGQKYVGFDKDLVIRKKVDRFLRDHGVSVDVVLEFDNIENIKQAIEISAGVALLPLPALRREVDRGTISAVAPSDAHLYRPLGIIHRRSPKPSPGAQKFVELLKQPDEPGSGDPAAAGTYVSGNKAGGPQPAAAGPRGPEVRHREGGAR